MKKVISLLCAVVIFCMVLAGCEGNSTPAVSVTPVELFEKVWAAYPEAKEFPVAGGDMDHANMEKPDVYDINANKDGFVSTFVVPEDFCAEITGDVITAMHMMNANTFCAAMMNIKDGSKAADLAESYKAAIKNNQWMCGMPEQFIVLGAGDLMVIAFGEADLIRSFKDMCVISEPALTVLADAPVEV